MSFPQGRASELSAYTRIWEKCRDRTGRETVELPTIWVQKPNYLRGIPVGLGDETQAVKAAAIADTLDFRGAIELSEESSERILA